MGIRVSALGDEANIIGKLSSAGNGAATGKGQVCNDVGTGGEGEPEVAFDLRHLLA